MGPDRAPLLTGYDLGKKSFKIDFTFNQPGKTMHLFLKPEKDFRITDPMTQSAYLKIVNSSNLKVEAGAYVVYGATHIPGKQASVGHWSREKAFIPAAVSDLPNGWSYTTLNISQQAQRFARRLKFRSKDAWYGGFLIMISGKNGKTIQKGDRITLYIDDISIQKSALSSQMSDPKKAEHFYLLGPRKRYEVRNRLYRRTVNGNSVRNSGFELGLEGWDHSRRGKAAMIRKELSTDAAQGQYSLKITHDAETDSLVWSDILHRRSDESYKISFLAKAEGFMKIGGQKIAPDWKLYRMPVWYPAKGTRGNVVAHTPKETDQKFVMFPIEGKGSVWIDAVSSDPNRESVFQTLPLLETAVGFQNGKALCNVFSDRDSFSINLYFWNGSVESGTFRLKYTVHDFYGRQITEGNYSEKIAGGSGWKRDIPFPRGIRGIFYVRLAVVSPTGKQVDSENACAVIAPLDSRKLNPGSIFGLSKPGGQQYDRMLELARMIGAKGLNQNGIMETVWGANMKDWRRRLVSGKPLFQYPVAGGEREREILEAGIEPLYLTRGIPVFLRPGFPYAYPDKPLSPEAMKEYADIVELFAREMPPEKKRAFDLFPESCADEKRIVIMKPYVKAVSDALRRASSKSEVLGCGFWDVSMMGKQVEWAAAHGYFREKILDGVTIHPYASNPDVSYLDSGLKQVRRTLDRERPGMPIVAAEVGYQNLTTFYSDIRGSEVQGWNSIYSEERTADYLARMMLIGLRHKVKRIMVFPALSAGSMPYPHHFGITYHNMMRPKAGLPALAGLTAQIHDAEFVALRNPENEYTVQLMKRARGDWLLAVWSYSDNKSLTTSVTLPGDLGQLRFIDLMNNEFIPEQKEFLLHGGSPVFIISPNRKNLERILSGIKFKQILLHPEFVVRDGKPFLRIENRTQETIPVQMKLFNHSVLLSLNSLSARSLRAGEVWEQELPLSENKEISLEAEIRSSLGNYNLKYRPLFVPRLPDRNAKWKDLPAAGKRILGKKDLRWRTERGITPDPVSPDDLSAVFHYAYDNRNLYLAFDVKDSVFHQPYSGTGIWQGDSVQIALDPLCNTNGLTRSYLFDDLEFGITLLANGKTEIIRYAGSENTEKNLQTEIEKKSDGVYYKIAIPWKVLGIHPKRDTKIGFNFVINDNDGKSLEKYLTLPPGGIAEHTGKTPFLFSDLVLQ